ncbi:MAG TPA: beta-galactosidase, partial [Ktedonobacterales bacterium]|nr:beta-galactosidase [Ktedonobacterales bacterium]
CFTLPVCEASGLYRIHLRYHTGDGLVMAQEQGFWIWDDALVMQTSGKRLSAGRDYLSLGDQIFPLFGTTYMDSLVQRKFLRLPNPARWDRDFAAMHQDGVNFIRTGIWTDWEQIMPTVGTSEAALRALDAFVMTACAHDLQVMFTFFSFCPPLIDGENAWLDPRSLRHQEAYVTLLAQRYHDVETVSWDLINEPSFGPPEHIFSQRAMPSRDPIERAAFRDWVRRRGDLDDVQMRWRLTPDQLPDWQAVAPPEDHDYSANVRDPTTRHMFRAHDFTHFSQDMITQWAGHLRDVIRETGNTSIVGIGQDESGSRPSPQFYGETMDFTTTHPWWNNDDLLWDLLMDKTPDRPHLSQETGVMLVRDVDGRPFRNGVEAGQLLER